MMMESQVTKISWSPLGVYCLLCSSRCEETDSSPSLDIPGGKHCESLRKRLERFFVLTRILDVDTTWCGELLRGHPSGEDGSWFSLCGKCRNERVLELWKIWRQIEELKRNMRLIKEQVREGMREQVKKGLECQRETSLPDFQIRRKLFPDLFNVVKTEITEEDVGPNFADDDTWMNSKEDDLVDADASSTLSDPDFVPRIRCPVDHEGLKRKRGRPPLPLHLRRPKKPRGRPPKPKSDIEEDSKSEPEDICDAASFSGDDNSPHRGPDFVPDETAEEKKPRKKALGRPRIPVHLLKPQRYPIQPHYKFSHWGTLKGKWRYQWKACPECGARYKFTEEYQAHEQCHQDLRDNKPEGILICEQCPFPTRYPSEMKIHVQKHHCKDNEQSKKTKPVKLYDCRHCPFQTMYWKMLAEHLNKEHGENAEDCLKCPHCPYHALNLQNYNTHQSQSHPKLQMSSGNLGLQCTQCPRRFSNEQDLQKHVDNTHERLNRYICEICGAGFQFPGKLKQHKARHADSTQSPRVCHLCGLTYRSEVHLKIHLRDTHRLGRNGKGKVNVEEKSDESFNCKYCELTSPFKWYIRKHQMEDHQDKLKYACEICGKRYSTPQGKCTHKKMSHGATPVTCQWCGKEFPSEVHIKEHLRKSCRVKKAKEAFEKERHIPTQVEPQSEEGHVDRSNDLKTDDVNSNNV